MTTKTAPKPKTTPKPKTAPQSAAVLLSLPVDRLTPHPDNVRRNVGDVTELAKSIAGTGVLEPLLVLPAGDDGCHLVVAGHRRLAAARKAGLSEVPAIVRDLTAAEVIEAMLVENLQRAEITPVEEARGYGRLIELDTKVTDIARKVGRSQPHVKGRLDLLTLPDQVLDLVDVGDVTLTEAADMVKLCAAHPRAWDLLAADPTSGCWAIERRIDRDAKDALLAEEREKLVKAGLTEFTKKDWWQGWKLELNKPQEVAKLELGKAGSKHRTEPCHAVRLQVFGSAAGGWRVERTTICTDPKRHTTLVADKKRSDLQIDPDLYDTDKPPAQVQVDKALAAARQAQLDAHAARTAFAAELIRSGRLPDLGKFAATQILINASETDFPEAETVALLFDHAAVKDLGDDADAWLAQLAHDRDAPAAELVAAAWAVLFAMGDSEYLHLDDVQAWAVFDELVGHGYQPTPWELDRQQARIEAAAPPEPAPVDVDELGLSDELTELLAGPSGAAGEVILPAGSELLADLEARGWAEVDLSRNEAPNLRVAVLTAAGARVAAALAPPDQAA